MIDKTLFSTEKRDSLLRFKSFLEDHHANFIIGGSLALAVQGVTFGREVQDVDMEVLHQSDLEHVFSCFEKANPVKGHTGYGESCTTGEKPYQFMWLGLVIKVWLVKKFTYKTFIYKDYIRYATVDQVLIAKTAYHRRKDYKDIMYLINKLSDLLVAEPKKETSNENN